ncbi:hypothetical protein [Enterobacter hormaechei]|nr:hypothetical protein [Enterobacter hormaechei]
MTCDKIPAPQDVAGQQENEEGHCRCYHLNPNGRPVAVCG